MRFLKALVLLLLSAAPCGAEGFVTPTQKISGAESPVPLGGVANLSVSPISPRPLGLQGASYTWELFDSDGSKLPVTELLDAVDPSGPTHAVFGTGLTAKTVHVLVVVTYLFFDQQGDKIANVTVRTVFLNADVVLGGGPPAPPPPPVLPDGSFKLAKTAYDLANKDVPPDSVRSAEARTIAASFRYVAQAVSDGVVTNVSDALKHATSISQAALGYRKAAPARWAPFFMELQPLLYSMANQGGAATWKPADFKEAWIEVALGLEAVQ